MKVVIGHYHLNPGGVSKIIQSQLNGFSTIKGLEVLIVCDGQGLENVHLPANATFRTSDSLAYLPKVGSEAELFHTVKTLLRFFKALCNPEDIIHFHNIGLGKNAALTYAMLLLSKQGYKIVNHAHDFPEDRPANLKYLEDSFKMLGISEANEVLYPPMDNYAFGVLNSHDCKRLIDKGIPEKRIQLWPNPVSLPQISSDFSKAEAKAKVEEVLGLKKDKMLVAYPVRVIRRKNIGEYILLAAAFAETANFIVTLPPLNPVEVEMYEQWVKFCAKRAINIVFEAGLKLEFDLIMKGADVCFTTSVMEGFGMVFVEPWLWDTPVAGREISAVLPDMKKLGLEYPLIYKRINVEHKGENHDFASLKTAEQMTFIEAVLNGEKDCFFAENKMLADFFKKNTVSFKNNNKNIIRKELSERQYGKKLHQFYKTLS